MKRFIGIIAILLFFCSSAFSMAKYADYVQEGGKSVKTSSTTTYLLMQTFPNATVGVYLPGTTTLATIYSNGSGTLKSNPFTADSKSYYEFYAANGYYDIKFSGTGIGTPWTRTLVVLSDPTENYNPKSFGAKCDNATNDTAAFTGLKTIIGSVNSTIDMPKLGPCRLDDFDFPANITLNFNSSGGLYANNAKIVNIVGDLIGPKVKLLYNGLAGQGTFSFSGNKSITAYYPQWWGLIGDGVVDDTNALQAAIDSIPSTSGNLQLTRQLVIKVTNTVKFWGKYSMHFGSDISLGTGSGTTTNVPIIIWYGADGGLVVDISKTRDSTFSGFMIFGNHLGYPEGIATGADKGIWLNQINSPVGDICTNNTFSHINIYMGTERTNATAVYIADPNNSNLEFMLFDQCLFNVGMGPANPDGSDGWGSNSACVNLDGSFNTKGIKFRKCTYLQANWAIKDSRGSFTDDGAESTYLNIMYEITENSDPVYILNGVTEAVRQVLVMNVPNNPIILIANNYQGTPSTGITYPIIDGLNGGALQLTAIGNDWGDFRLPGGAINPAIVNVFKGAPGSFGANINFQHNTILGVYNSVLLQNYSTFAGGNVDGVTFTGYTIGEGASTDFLTTTGLQRRALAIQGPTLNGALKVAATDNITLAGDSVEFFGIANPNIPNVANIGTAGSTTYNFAILVLDANGNRTMRSPRAIVNANATLSGSNYIKLDWTQVPGDVGGYDIINDGANNDNGPWQLVAHVTSGVTTYNVVANPATPFTYTLPTFNETIKNGFRGQNFPINAITFANGDTTPSVRQSNLFITANSAATLITNLTQGVANQEVTIQCTEANSTFVNGGTIKLNGGVSFVCSPDDLITLVLRGSVWREKSRSVN